MRFSRYRPYCRRVIVEYGTAVVFVGAATFVTAFLRKIFPGLPGSLFFCAVMLSVWRGGLGPGLLASILSSAVFVLWVAPPAPIPATPWHEVPRIVMLLFASLFISWLCGQQKRAQEALQQTRDELEQRVNERTKDLAASEAKLKEAQRLANIGYWERDLVTNRITWSEETCRIFGLPSRPRGLSQTELQEMIHPDDRQLQTQALSEALQGPGIYDVEYRVLLPGGKVRSVHVRDQIERDALGQPTRMFGTVQDITERKRAEEAVRASQQLLEPVLATCRWAWR
jgi:PAS domain S-box-containing protein